MKTCGLFVDVQNLYYGLSKKYPTRKLDYDAFFKTVKEKYEVYRAFAYGVQKEEEALKFIKCLKWFGYETKFREPRPYSSWDVGLTLDVITILDKIDIAIIGSNSRDLEPMLDYVSSRGIQTNIVACGIPSELRRKVTRYQEIDDRLLHQSEFIVQDEPSQTVTVN